MSDLASLKEPWKLILILEDPEALRVAAAYYALPAKQRRDAERIADIAGIDHGVDQILTRLRLAGMLEGDQMPQVLTSIINARVLAKLRPKE